MLQFLRSGEKAESYAIRTLDAIQAGREQCLSGVNEETLVYSPDEVKLLAPLPNPASCVISLLLKTTSKWVLRNGASRCLRSGMRFRSITRVVIRTSLALSRTCLWPSFTEKFDY